MTHNQAENTPQFYCALKLFLNSEADAIALVDTLHYIGINDAKLCRPRFEPVFLVKCAIVDNERFWHMDEALSKMFFKIECHIAEIKKSMVNFNATAQIDIAFYQYGIFPSLELSRRHLQITHDLNAEISIDPYCC